MNFKKRIKKRYPKHTKTVRVIFRMARRRLYRLASAQALLDLSKSSTMHYILDENKNIVPCRDILEWGMWFETADRSVAKYKEGDFFVSTVFLGIDHDFSGHAEYPVLFETMVFHGDKEWDGYTERYCTYAQALEGHNLIVERVKRHSEKIRASELKVLPTHFDLDGMIAAVREKLKGENNDNNN